MTFWATCFLFGVSSQKATGRAAKSLPRGRLEASLSMCPKSRNAGTLLFILNIIQLFVVTGYLQFKHSSNDNSAS